MTSGLKNISCPGYEHNLIIIQWIVSADICHRETAHSVLFCWKYYIRHIFYILYMDLQSNDHNVVKRQPQTEQSDYRAMTTCPKK